MAHDNWSTDLPQATYCEESCYFALYKHQCTDFTEDP